MGDLKMNTIRKSTMEAPSGNNGNIHIRSFFIWLRMEVQTSGGLDTNSEAYKYIYEKMRRRIEKIQDKYRN